MDESNRRCQLNSRQPKEKKNQRDIEEDNREDRGHGINVSMTRRERGQRRRVSFDC